MGVSGDGAQVHKVSDIRGQIEVLQGGDGVMARGQTYSSLGQGAFTQCDTG